MLKHFSEHFSIHIPALENLPLYHGITTAQITIVLFCIKALSKTVNLMTGNSKLMSEK